MEKRIQQRRRRQQPCKQQLQGLVCSQCRRLKRWLQLQALLLLQPVLGSLVGSWG